MEGKLDWGFLVPFLSILGFLFVGLLFWNLAEKDERMKDERMQKLCIENHQTWLETPSGNHCVK